MAQDDPLKPRTMVEDDFFYRARTVYKISAKSICTVWSYKKRNTGGRTYLQSSDKLTKSSGVGRFFWGFMATLEDCKYFHNKRFDYK